MTTLIHDTWTMFQFNLKLSLRNTVWLILGLFQPICYLLLLAPLLDNLTGLNTFEQGNAFNVFTPGLLIMTGMFGSGFAGWSMIFSLKEGVIERLRVTPVNRVALVLGLVLRDALVLVVQAALLIGVSMLFGLEPDFVGTLLVLALVGLLAIMIASTSYGLALMIKEDEAFAAALNFIIQPLVLLSGILLPMSLAPTLLRRVSDLNPLTHAVEAARSLMNGQMSDNAIPVGFAITLVLAVLALYWATRSMRQATA